MSKDTTYDKEHRRYYENKAKGHLSEARVKANRRWNSKHPSKAMYYSYKSTAKRYIQNFVKTPEQAQEVKDWITIGRSRGGISLKPKSRNNNF